MSDLNDLFPGPPDRPDTPEFWQLSEIVLGFDSMVENCESDEQFVGIVTRQNNGFPTEVVDYMAFNRTFPALQCFHPLALMSMGPENIHAFMMAAWSDAFCAGMEYQRKYGKEES